SFAALGQPRALPSFPTRRSSDLPAASLADQALIAIRGARPDRGALTRKFTQQVFDRIATIPWNDLPGEPDDNLAHAIEESSFLRSEEHTSELQSRGHLVCRLLLE